MFWYSIFTYGICPVLAVSGSLQTSLGGSSMGVTVTYTVVCAQLKGGPSGVGYCLLQDSITNESWPDQSTAGM